MKVVFGIFGICLLATACVKDGLENTYPQNTYSNGMLGQYLAQHSPAIQTFTFNAVPAGGFTGANGTQISWTANAFVYPNGQPVTGNITLTLIEVLNKQDALYARASTTSNGRPLISGGQIRLIFSQGNQELQLANNNCVGLSMFAGNEPNCGHGMQEFYADEIGLNQDFDQQPGDTIYYCDNPTLLGSPYFYSFMIDHTGWINVDQVMNAGEQTTFNASLPVIFDDSNCMVFVSFDGQFSMARLYHYDESTNSYGSGTYYTLPVDVPVTFVAIGEINGQFYYDQVSRVVIEQLSISLNPAPATTAEIEAHVSALH